MQRDIRAIVVAHQMDSRRRELYVEGRRDRLFFLWLSRKDRDPDAVVQEIDSVKCGASVEGGCRGRLLRFAADISSFNLKVRCFADADFDRILRRSVPNNVWLTDRRDLEGYFFQLPCIEKVLHLAIATDRYKPHTIIGEVSRLGRPLGLLRLLSEREGLKLPFQKCPPKPYLKEHKGCLQLKFEAYLQTLLQEAKISLRRLVDIKATFQALCDGANDVPDTDLLHGKDCIAILQVILTSDEFKADAIEPSFWASLENELIMGFPNLGAALAYLRRAA